MSNAITYIGSTDYRAKNTKFGIKDDDRTRHMYIIGKTGMGKSTLIENMIIQDIHNGNGVCFIDPHGSSAEAMLKFIPEHRIKDVIYFAPHDLNYPLALNVLEQVDESQRHLVANGLMAAFKKIFGEEKFSDRIQYILNNIILALLENEGQTLLGVNRMLSDPAYRKFIVSNVKDPSVRAFWNEEFVKAGEKYAQEAAPGIQNKIGQFISNPLIRNIIGQKKTSFDIREIMDNKKILICNFSMGRMGEGNVNLLGNLMITKIYIAAMSRANLGADEMSKTAPFYFYVDEFQNFVNESFAHMLSQARKYNLALTVAHQYVEQMTDEVKAAVFGNVGTMILFRVGAEDAERFEKEFAPQFTMDDIVNLSARQIYLRLSIDGVGSKPFSATTLPRLAQTDRDYTEAIIDNSRATNSKTKVDAEEEVLEFYKPIVIAKPPAVTVKTPTSDKNTSNSITANIPDNSHNKNASQISTERKHIGIGNKDNDDTRRENEYRNRQDEDRRRENDRPKKEKTDNNSLRSALNVALGIDKAKTIDLQKERNEQNKNSREEIKKENTNYNKEIDADSLKNMLSDTDI